MTPLGVRGVKRSVAAMKAPRTHATVVKKPKTFWRRVKEECMLGGARMRSLRWENGVSVERSKKRESYARRRLSIAALGPWDGCVGGR